MKIINELIALRIGKKKYEFNNLILDEYLKRFARAQLDKNNITRINNDKKLYFCLLKFDTPFENLSGSSVLHNQDFDICILSGCNTLQEINENQINMQYNYDTSVNVAVWDYELDTSTHNYIKKYYGKKITAIGFNSYWDNDSDWENKFPVCAVLDTSNYNIYLQENQDLTITRKDIITTDSLFYTNNKNKISGPIHLCPDRISQLDFNQNIRNGGILYSIGLSSYPDYIDKEFVIGEDIEAILNGTEIDINVVENYMSNSSLFCNENLFPSSSIYPIKSNYKYIIFKYKVWQVESQLTETITDTGYYYYEAIPIEKLGKNNLKIKYERG